MNWGKNVVEQTHLQGSVALLQHLFLFFHYIFAGI